MLFFIAVLALQDARFEGRAEARLETRARTASGADVPDSAVAGDAEVTPVLFGALDNLGGRIALRYGPTLRVREPYTDPRPTLTGTLQGGRRTEVNNTQTFEASWAREGRPRFYLLENFYQGTVDLASQATTTTVTPGAMAPLPTGSTVIGRQINQLSVDVNGGVASPLSKLTVLDTSAGFFYGTGLDTTSLFYVPAQRAARTKVQLETQLTAVDALIGAIDGTYAVFPGIVGTEPAMPSNGPQRNVVTNATVRWRRQLLASTAFELGLGGGVIYIYRPAQREEAARPELNIPRQDAKSQFDGAIGAPGGAAILTHRINTGPHLLNFEGGLRVAPFIDRWLATAYDRAELGSTLAYAFRERWVLALRASISTSIMSQASNGELFTTWLEARAGYVAPRYWRLELTGVNSTFVLGTGAPVDNWQVGLSLTLHAEGQI